jgi:hypothetical protein
MAELAGGPEGSPEYFIIDNDTGSYSSANKNANQVSVASAGANPMLPQSSEVEIAADFDFPTGQFLKILPQAY